jgi:hypothetical protein
MIEGFHILCDAATGAFRGFRDGYADEELEGGAIEAHEVDHAPIWSRERWDADTRTLVEDLSGLTAMLCRDIDREAGRVRCRYISTGEGQQMTYLDKEAQARACIDDPSPDDDPETSPYPMIAREAARRALSMHDHAALVIAMADYWRPIGALIEDLRQAGHIAVKAATTEEAKRAAALVDWSAVPPPA